MFITRLLGGLLRVIAVLWLVNGAIGIVAGYFWAGVLVVAASWPLYQAGKWLWNRPRMQPAKVQAKRAEGWWWGTSHGFRLSAFCGLVWVVGALVFVDHYRLDPLSLLGPPVGLLAIYFGYRLFVVHPSQRPCLEVIDSEPSEAEPHAEAVIDEPVKPAPVETSATRARDMDELIRRMNASG